MRASLLAGTAAIVMATMAATSMAEAATATRAAFGTIPGGQTVEAVTLTNGRGTTIRVITLGAGIQSVMLPDRNGKVDDVSPGYDTAAEYVAKPQYLGVSVGRYANRIAKGQFTLNGASYQLAAQNNGQHLHGGLSGFDKKLWRIENVVASGANASVTMRYTSPDGEEGYPGTLQASVTYALNDQNEFSVTYGATTDKPTIVNLTNHNFWNMGGINSGRGIEGQLLTLHAARYTPVDNVLIPTGALTDVRGTPFDFRSPALIGPRVRDARDPQIVIGRGIDHNYVIDGAANTLRRAARLEDPVSGRVMELSVTAPGVQVYTGNFMDGTVSGKGRILRMTDAIALEPQVFPDTPNQPAFGSARLDPGQTYSNRFVFRFSVAR